MSARAPITKAGSERLRAELERLKSGERPRIIAAIAEARAHGDLKENAEYHAARELQSFIEGRIAQLEALLSTAEVIDVSRLNPGSKVVFGAIVDLADEDSGAEVTYQIVGDLEADIKQGLIAVSSPIARALIGKNEGDSFEFTAPNGVKHYEITGVRYS
ncbi:MAG: transcription elongation factor GreA [Rhodanobacter sp. 68-29]|uniref:transcription elongation factor GreA n=1 Tax=Rhodanobacter sp. PCA2 TaxID=2006117 RepID=UPI00086C42DF|nr:transcription elongation factor GreA [Rhodanobacter sp. PCA2]MBA2078501.1 transcription elongation factor GreA [Rhodanobacter sp. PCA2]MBN8921557.1 transcription elongation factor GreA [Rhodanobacter sp.]ODU74920.1 MAG: transcription elongation factor GreA [Rhodanobacter sp. SCN 69-32]OJY61436.1 MAG: transcription elongation factor GreA [Rhodanobacter sp. 68-29]